MKIINAWIKTQNTEEPSLIECDSVNMKYNHLFFYLKKEMVFKVWLRKEYKTLEDALKDVGINPTK